MRHKKYQIVFTFPDPTTVDISINKTEKPFSLQDDEKIDMTALQIFAGKVQWKCSGTTALHMQWNHCTQLQAITANGAIT